MSKRALVLPVAVFSLAALSAQQNPPPPSTTPPPYAAIPADVVKQPNPVKPSPESLARGQKWWGMDCVMCHDQNGDGKGEVALSMKLTLVDFKDPATFKDRTDGEIWYVIKNGHQPMPAEGDRVKPEELWDLVNYVRSLSKPAAAPVNQKP